MVLQTVVTTILDIKVDYDFKLTAATYNFSWYFNGKELLIPLSYEEPVVALVKEESKKQLQARILSTKREIDIGNYLAKIKFVLGIEEDLKEFYDIWAKDKLFRKSLRILKGIHLRATSLWNMRESQWRHWPRVWQPTTAAGRCWLKMTGFLVLTMPPFSGRRERWYRISIA